MLRGLKSLLSICGVGLLHPFQSVVGALPLPFGDKESMKTFVVNGHLEFEDLSNEVPHSRLTHENKMPFFDFLQIQASDESPGFLESVSGKADYLGGQDTRTVVLDETYEAETKSCRRPRATQPSPQAPYPGHLSINEEHHFTYVRAGVLAEGQEIASAQASSLAAQPSHKCLFTKPRTAHKKTSGWVNNNNHFETPFARLESGTLQETDGSRMNEEILTNDTSDPHLNQTSRISKSSLSLDRNNRPKNKKFRKLEELCKTSIKPGYGCKNSSERKVAQRIYEVKDSLETHRVDSRREIIKHEVGKYFVMKLETKKLPKSLYPILLRHNGQNMSYGPFHVFNSISMENLKHNKTLETHEYTKKLKTFLEGYAGRYSKSWLSKSVKRDRSKECRITSELYIQSGISNAKRVGIFKDINAYFFRKRQEYDCQSKRHGGIDYKINLSKNITFMFIQHIRFLYEIIKINYSQDQMESIILTHQRDSIDFSFRFWDSFNFNQTSLFISHNVLEDSSKAPKTPRDSLKEPKHNHNGKESIMIQWSWHLLKEYLIFVNEPLNEILFGSKNRTKSLESFARHCVIAELMHG